MTSAIWPGELTGFVNDNRESLGITADKLASVSQALHDSIPDIKEVLHVAPNTFQNFLNIYQPAQGTLIGSVVGQQLPEPDHVPVRGNPGGLTHGCRTVREVVRAVSGADHQEPPVQLPAARTQPDRRPHRPAQRTDLQRGLDAPGLRPAATADPGCSIDRRNHQPMRRRPPSAGAIHADESVRPA